MIFGCPKCQFASSCTTHAEFDRLIMRHSESLDPDRIWSIYEAFGMACRQFKTERRDGSHGGSNGGKGLRNNRQTVESH